MEVALGTYFRHQRYGLGRLVRWEQGLFPRVYLRFEDGMDRTLELDPADPVEGPMHDPVSDPPASPRAGLALAPARPRFIREGSLHLVDGGDLEKLPGFDATAERIIFTIGYEGQTLEQFIQRLGAHRVGVVVDIREAPVSKRHGFTKRELQAKLKAAGVGYIMKREWGNPKRKAGGVDERRDPRGAMTAYTEYLAPHIVDAAAFVQDIMPRRPAFLCYEAEPFHCHRSRFTSLVLPHCQPQPAVHHILPD